MAEQSGSTSRVAPHYKSGSKVTWIPSAGPFASTRPTDVAREVQADAGLVGSRPEQRLTWLVKFAAQPLPAASTPQWDQLLREIKGFIPHASWMDTVGIDPEPATVRRLEREVREAIRWLTEPDGGYWSAKLRLAAPFLSRTPDYGLVSASAIGTLPGRFLSAAVNILIQVGQRLRRLPQPGLQKGVSEHQGAAALLYTLW